MPDTDSVNLLKQALANQESGDTIAWQGLNSKQAQVDSAVQRNLQRLREVSTVRENTWVNKAGVDYNSVAGRLVNTGASIASATARTAGDLASLPDNFVSLTHQLNARPELVEAFQRYQTDSATEQDWALLNTRFGHNIEASEQDGYVPGTPEAVRRAENALTNLEVFENALVSRQRADRIHEATDLSDTVDQRARQGLSEDLLAAEPAIDELGQAWDGIRDGELKDNVLTFVSSLAELAVTGGGAALTNPQAMMEYTAEQVPDLAVGALSRPALLLRNIGYGLDTYQQGIDNYAAENDGQLPPEDVQKRMAVSALGMSVLDSIGELKMLDSTGMVRQAIRENRSGIGAAARAAAKNAGVEGSTEAAQTVLEGEALLDPASGADIFEGAVVGAGVGGGIAGASAAVEGARATREVREEEQTEANAVARTEDEQIADYIRNGDFDGLAQDPNLPADRAAVAIHQVVTQEGASQEERASGRQALAKLQTSLDRRIQALETEGGFVSKEREAQTKEQIRRIDALLIKAKEQGDSEGVQQLTQIRKDQVAGLKAGRAVSPERRKLIEKELSGLKQARKLAEGNREQLSTATPNLELQRSLVTEATNSESSPETRKIAADQAVTLLMSGTSTLTDTDVAQLLEKAGDVLDSDQQTYLRSLTAAQQARNAASDLESVNQDIFSGSGDGAFKGLPDYRRSVMAALDAGELSAAQQELEALEQFSQSHQAKAQLAQQANEQATRARKPFNIWRDYGTESGWRLTPGAGKKDDALLRKNGGFQVGYGPRYERVVTTLKTEAEAISATLAELGQAVSLSTRQENSTEQPVAASTGTESTDTSAEPSVQTEETVDAEPAPKADDRPQETEPTATAQETAAEPESTRERDSGPSENPDTVDVETETDDSTPVEVKPNAIYPHIRFEPVHGGMDSATFRSADTNLIGAYFGFRKRRDNDTSKHPLTDQQDFLSRVLVPATAGGQYNVEALRPYLPDLAELDTQTESSPQMKAIGLFASKARGWNKTLDGIFKTKATRYRYTDLVQYFADENGRLPENVKTAISGAAFTWLQDSLSGQAMNTEKDVRRILGLTDSDPMPPDALRDLRFVGTRESNVQQALGRGAFQALGLRLNADAPTNHQAQLETALGAYSMNLLVREGFIERREVRSTALPKSDGGKALFVRPVRESWSGVYPLPDQSQQIVDVSRNTQGVVGKLFGVEQARLEPEFAPIPFTQKTTKGTGEAVPRHQQEIIKGEQAKPWVIRDDMRQIVSALETLAPERARRLLYRMAGAVDLSTYKVQKANQYALEGKNQGLQREVDSALGFFRNSKFTEDPTTPFYIPLSVWSNQRVGMSSLINPLESKVHRFLIGKQEWVHQVPLKGNAEGVNADAKHKLRQFRLAVLEGLGEPVDKLSNATVLKRYVKTVKAVQPHVDVVRALLTGEPVSEQSLQDMADFVADKEQLHTFDTILHLARRQLAEMSGQTTFTSTLIREGDGITNGPALATILSGAWGSTREGLALVNKMGFFEKGNPIQSAGQWQEVLSNNDLYQSLAHRVDERVRQLLPHANDTEEQQYRSVFALIGYFTDKKGGVTKDGRKRVKTPLTAMAFGSSVPKAVRAMGEDLVDNFYSDIEGILNDAKKTDAQKQSSINHLAYHMNTLMAAPRLKLKTLSLDQAQQLVLSADQRQAAVTAFTNTVGKQIQATLDEQFNSPKAANGKPDPDKHSFIQYRKRLNDVAKQSFELFRLARDYEVRQFQQELMAAGELAWTWTGKKGARVKTPIQSLNRKQLRNLDARLKGLNPLVHTAMSKASQHREAGLHMGKPVMQSMLGNSAYAADVTFGQALNTTTADGKTRGSQALKRFGQAMDYSDPGVRVFITNVHAFDSAIASDTYKDFPALNVHDAEIVAAYMMQDVARQMNGATFRHLVDFSLGEEVVKTGYRVYDNFKARLPEMKEDQQFQREYRQALGGSLKSVEQTLQRALRGANTAESQKLKLMAQLKTVNQYGVEGGEYTLIEADYARIAERQKISITERVARDRAKTVGDTASSLMAEISGWVDTADPRTFPAPQGTPATAGDPRLISMLEREPVQPARTLLRRLSSNPLNRALARLVNPALQVRYVTANTPRESLPQHELAESRGYYTIQEGKEEIGVLSPDFAESLVTEEVITHEVLHSVLYHTVENVRNGRDTRSDAKAFVRELEQLQAKTVDWLSKPENAAIKDKYLNNTNALDSVHELIAWGMTNSGFQTEVLAKVPMQTQNKGRLRTALVTFVNAIARFLFGNGAGKVRDNGVGVLLVNTAGLMDQAKQKRDAAQAATLLQRSGPQPEDVRRWTSQQIFTALDDNTLSPAGRDRLTQVLDQVVTKVQGVQGPWLAQTDAQSPIDRFAVAKATGEMPFSSEAIGQFPLSRQQMFVLEQAEVALRESMATDSLAYKELTRVFRDARDRLSPKDFLDGDWGVATTDQKAAAQEKYDFLFKLQTLPGERRSNHLSRFAAMVLVSPDLHDKLNESVTRETPSGTGLGDRVKSLYDTSMERLGDHLNRTYREQPVNQRVQSLAYRLADIRAKHKNTLAHSAIGISDQVDAAAARLGEAAKNRLGSVADSDLFAGSENGFMQALGETGSAIAEDRVNEVLESLQAFRDYTFKQRQGFFASMLTELRGATEKTQPFHKLLRMGGQNERQRKHIQENLKQDVLSRFAEPLDQEHSDALTRSVLRTDLSALTPHFTDEQLQSMMESPQVLKEAIQQWEDQVESHGSLGSHYVAYSKLLGYFMATGKARGPNMSLNAYNIARGAGTRFQVSAQKAERAENDIDVLTSLYALDYTSSVDRQRAATIFRKENRRDRESGIRYLLKLHEKLKAEAVDTLFDGDKSLFIKGYTREIYNPYTEIVSEVETAGKDLVAQGWKRLPKHLVKDSADPDQREKFLYVRQWGGLQQHVTGSVSYTGTRRKGSAAHGGQYIPSQQAVHNENVQSTQTIAAEHLNQMKRVSAQGRRIAPESLSANYMVPVRSPQGDSVNFRYFMTEQNKDDLLERNNRVEDIVASMASHMFDKVSTQTQNRHVMESLKAFYDQEYQRRPESFITIGPDSEDAQARETYHLLPPKTKEIIHQIWGAGGVKVRVDMVDMVFGYRKFSVENLMDKPQVQSRVVQAILHHLADIIASKYLLGDKARARLRQGEDIWQSLVQIVKDNWVIKNLSTLMDNISSNVSILLWSGMSPKKVIETHKTAISGLLEYTEHQDELMRLERELSLGLSTDTRALEQRIIELRDAMDRNPVKVLMDEGLFQTIVEDVDAETDDYSYKSQILARVSAATEGVPEGLKTAGKWAVMTHDTPLYKLLFKSTQMSDFVARYSLYQHLTTRSRNPMPHDEAIQRVTDTFVNYDVPTHRTLQYLNDMGAVFFTKYYLRIQKVLIQLMQENPVRGIGLMLLENYFSGLSTVLDSSPRLANPFDTGALNLPGSMTEILPIKGLLSFW